MLLLIAAAAAFVTLVGVVISVALSAAEGRADLATLASSRRASVPLVAAFVAALGTRSRLPLVDRAD